MQKFYRYGSAFWEGYSFILYSLVSACFALLLVGSVSYIFSQYCFASLGDFFVKW